MLKSVGAVMVPTVFLLFTRGSVAQSVDTNFMANCDLSTLAARVSSLTSECCSMNEAGCGGASTCTVNCLSALLPLLDDCQDVINPLFDGQDGVLDGQASAFSDSRVS